MRLFKNDSINMEHLKHWEKDALEKFSNKMTDKNMVFPCIPAIRGFTLKQLRYGFTGDPRSDSTTKELASTLRAYTEHSRTFGPYTSLILFFETTDELKEKCTVEQFEQLFWKLLNRLSALDQIDWPNHIPVNPHNPVWEYCFHGEKYFMFCATPSHKHRKSRHFPYFMLAITPRWVLEEFHLTVPSEQKVRSIIRDRLKKYDSRPPHPSLNSYGHADNFEWQQYFLHDDNTTLSQCPFHRIINCFKVKR